MDVQPKKRSWVSYALAVVYISVVLVVFYYSPFFQYYNIKQQLNDLLLIAEPTAQQQLELEKFFFTNDLMIDDQLLVIDRFLELMIERNMADVPTVLVYVIENDTYDDELRKRVLAEIAKPMIFKRDVYRTDLPVIVLLQSRMGKFNNHRIEKEIELSYGGIWGSAKRQDIGLGSITEGWCIGDRFTPPYEPGIYDEKVTQTIKLYEGAASSRINPDDESPLFVIKQDITFKLVVKSPDEVKSLQVIQGNELSKSIIDAFTVHAPVTPIVEYRGRHNYLMINARKIPSSIAFELFFVDQNSVEHPIKNGLSTFVDPGLGQASNGWSIQFDIPSITESGEYSGALIFRPSDEVAFKNPRITEYWGGEFELPFSFTVVDKRANN